MLTNPLNSVLNVKVLVDAFNQEKVLVGAFSVIIQTCRPSFAALVLTGSGQQLGSSMSSYEGCSSSFPPLLSLSCVSRSGVQEWTPVCVLCGVIRCHTPCMISTSTWPCYQCSHSAGCSTILCSLAVEEALMRGVLVGASVQGWAVPLLLPVQNVGSRHIKIFEKCYSCPQPRPAQPRASSTVLAGPARLLPCARL